MPTPLIFWFVGVLHFHCMKWLFHISFRLYTYLSQGWLYLEPSLLNENTCARFMTMGAGRKGTGKGRGREGPFFHVETDFAYASFLFSNFDIPHLSSPGHWSVIGAIQQFILSVKLSLYQDKWRCSMKVISERCKILLSLKLPRPRIEHPTKKTVIKGSIIQGELYQCYIF